MHKIRYYMDKKGRQPFLEWLNNIRDKKAWMAILRRTTRLEFGNYGDHKPLREGVWELRIDVGKGYRIYYAKDGLKIIILLCGGDKRKQSSDIDRACVYWHDWQERGGE